MCAPSFIPFPLLVAALALSFTARDGRASDQTPGARSDHAAPFRLPARITTLDGKTYEKVTLDKVEPDGLLVLFAPVEGGSGAAKLKFRNLPHEFRERFGYDPARATDYEAARAHGEAAWRAEAAVWTQQRQAARAEQAAWERQARAEAELRRAEAERAGAEAARYTQQQAAYFYPGWWSGYYGHHHRSGGRAFKSHVPRPLPVVGVKSSPASRPIGPMRPSGK